MSHPNQLICALQSGAHDETLCALYAPDKNQAALNQAKERILRLIEDFQTQFGGTDRTDLALFSGPGRTEIGGNHTDHQHGHVLCGSVNLDMIACAAPNGTDTVCIYSEGYPPLRVCLGQLAALEEERNTSAALVRGIAAQMTGMGHTLRGFDACVTSNVPAGSGLSSSAAYEVLVCNILNHFFCGGTIDPIEIAKISQYAENVYFGKPCGLMDQTASSVGNAVSIDFKDPSTPIVKKVEYDFSKSGHALCIIDSGSCHADLTDDYAQITREMGAVAAYFGQKFLRDVPEETFFASIPDLRRHCGDRAVLRAMHYYADDRRAVAEAEALNQGDFDRFLALVNESGLSSATDLQNIWSVADPQQQAVSLALSLGKTLLEGTGAIRVHGGGFAGTIQAFVPNEKLSAFKAGMEAVLGPNKCHVLHIRPKGGCLVIS